MKAAFCQIASFTNVAEAEWARCRLGFEGIRSRLDTVEMILWFWYYSNLLGGVKVLVSPEDAQRASEILQRADPPQVDPKWPCSHCNELLPNEWNVCWRCGMARDGTKDPDFFEDRLAVCPRTSNFGIVTIVTYFALLALGFTGNLFVGGLSWFFLMAFLMSLRDLPVDEEGEAIDQCDPGAEPEPVLSAREQSFERRRQMGRHTAFRTLHVAVFSLAFFPLTLGALFLLIRLSQSKIRLGPLGRICHCAAWFITVMAVGYGVLFWGPLFVP